MITYIIDVINNHVYVINNKKLEYVELMRIIDYVIKNRGFFLLRSNPIPSWNVCPIKFNLSILPNASPAQRGPRRMQTCSGFFSSNRFIVSSLYLIHVKLRIKLRNGFLCLIVDGMNTRLILVQNRP